MASSPLPLSTTFDSDRLPEGLAWTVGAVPNWTAPAGPDGGLRVIPDEKTDFWQKTYYKPDISKGNGHVLALSVEKDAQVVIETSFAINAKQQFDQAGLMVWVDEEHWLKTGLEFCDGRCQMGCVVTNKFSDWSLRGWPNSELTLRVYKLSDSCVVEVCTDSGSWEMCRLSYLNMAAQQCLVGLFTCAPTAAGSSVVFRYLRIEECDGYHHHA